MPPLLNPYPNTSHYGEVIILWFVTAKVDSEIVAFAREKNEVALMA